MLVGQKLLLIIDKKVGPTHFTLLIDFSATAFYDTKVLEMWLAPVY